MVQFSIKSTSNAVLTSIRICPTPPSLTDATNKITSQLLLPKRYNALLELVNLFVCQQNWRAQFFCLSAHLAH